MAQVEQPMFILPKKRNSKKQNSVSSHVDHIISVQGAVDLDSTPTKYKNGLSPVSEHNNIVNGIIHSTMEGLKSNMKMNLPIITDDHDEDVIDSDEKHQNGHKNGYQALSTINNSRDIIDLSPIYENSSDAYSSHGDLRENVENDLQKSTKMLSDFNESSSATPNSLSQTQSENSFEMGTHTDSLKNSAKRKKRVNIVPGINESENTDTEITALRLESESSISPDCSMAETSSDGYLTMTGTIKRGKKKGQNIDVKLNISREELEIIEAAIVAEEFNKMDISKCSLYNGLHIFLFTLICLPFVACISAMYSFYMGTMTWYNIFTHVTEDLNCLKKIFLAPIVILSFPFLIVIFTVGLGLYAGIVQLSFSGANWWKDVCDYEKGFYGWLCSTLGMSECSPYEVVILMDVKP